MENLYDNHIIIHSTNNISEMAKQEIKSINVEWANPNTLNITVVLSGVSEKIKVDLKRVTKAIKFPDDIIKYT